jgi:hypothetical protein
MHREMNTYYACAHALPTASTSISAGDSARSGLSPYVVALFKSNAFEAELAEACVLYFFKIKFYDGIVSTR